MRTLLTALISCLILIGCNIKQQNNENKDSERAEILFHTTMGDFKMALFNETPLH